MATHGARTDGGHKLIAALLAGRTVAVAAAALAAWDRGEIDEATACGR